jgi:hypothetical protein
MIMTERAKRAPLGHPAPNSFDTLVLKEESFSFKESVGTRDSENQLLIFCFISADPMSVV